MLYLPLFNTDTRASLIFMNILCPFALACFVILKSQEILFKENFPCPVALIEPRPLLIATYYLDMKIGIIIKFYLLGLRSLDLILAPSS